MDNSVLIIAATLIEGICAVKIARKFNDTTPSWKFFIPVYNVLTYGRFSLLSSRFVLSLAFIQGADLVLSFTKAAHPLLLSSQIPIAFMSFLMWAIMVSRIAVRLGQGFWSYLSATVLSAVASSFAITAFLYAVLPSYNGTIENIPLWAEILAVFIMSLPFISLAFDKKVQYLHSQS